MHGIQRLERAGSPGHSEPWVPYLGKV